MAPKPIIRPGPTAAGPPGWEEKQKERLSSVATQSSSGETGGGSHGRSSSTQSAVIDGVERDDKGVPIVDQETGQLSHQPVEYQQDPPKEAHVSLAGKIKSKFHKVGEKLAFVPPRDAEAGVSTQVSTVVGISSDGFKLTFPCFVAHRMPPPCLNDLSAKDPVHFHTDYPRITRILLTLYY